MTTLPTATPESVGVPSNAVAALLGALEAEPEPHGLVIVRRGAVVADVAWAPYRRELPHTLYSLSKSFASTAVGLAAAEGVLDVDERVLDIFPGHAPAEPGANLRAMRVRHLLSMATGHDADVTEATLRTEGSPLTAFLAQQVDHEPGTHFAYNSAATFMLSAIIGERTGMPLLDYLRPRLLEPLGITDATWERHPSGIDYGGWGLALRAPEIARFGELLLRRGRWGDRQLVPAEWIDEATRAHVPNGENPDSDWNQGYGYQFWRCRHDAYRGDGAFGQFCVVVPEHELVVAITSGVANMQAVLDALWTHLLPPLHASPLPDDPAAQARLAERIAGASLAPPAGNRWSPRAAERSGVAWSFEPNEAGLLGIAFDATSDEVAIRQEAPGAPSHEWRVRYGREAWRESTMGALARTGRLPGDGVRELPVAASGTWITDDRFQLTIRELTSPHVHTFDALFSRDEIVLERRVNVAFGPTELPKLRGHREGRTPAFR